MTASPNCLRLLTHWERRAASRAACTAGNSRAIKTAMIAITTSNSIRVKPFLVLLTRRSSRKKRKCGTRRREMTHLKGRGSRSQPGDLENKGFGEVQGT